MPLTLHPDHVPEEYKSDYKSYTENAEGVPVIDKKSMEQFYEYTGVDPKDKSYFTALDTENLKNFPPTYICTCEFDPLRDDGQIMAKALEKNGVSVKTDYYEGESYPLHCSLRFPMHAASMLAEHLQDSPITSGYSLRCRRARILS